ncbi:P-loop containing nucleoside triphosphate hydrolase protein [Dendrothele bispora CBS 962.96]|uniref:P-loop containing nucleoside triphosphate hydrolase protein n=1 Tax=Dendrothele bispora (strain CBS 962.96) TaxID=1314807 RepID=A0A4S8MQ12_DENBC|nr:P-loop containing nucleoside triphosphate hydrolase protein [Dendrothele bispora CBS 962.96]
MQTPRITRSVSSVLGKRAHHSEQSLSFCEQLQTPEPTPNPKRARTSSVVVDGSWNKENVPPFNLIPVAGEISPVRSRLTRSLRRNTTEEITPPRAEDSLRRRASSSNIPRDSTPATAISHLAISTPPPTPPSFIPIHARARALLRSTCNDSSSMPGRENERAILVEFITNFLESSPHDDFLSLYISGSPGSGKTALVNSVIDSVDIQSKGAKIVVINCMALRDVDALWERIIEELEGLKKRKSVKSKKAKTFDSLDVVIKNLDTKCILVLDELDNLVKASQSATTLLTLPNSASSRLRVIGIANTHTLTTSTSPASSSVRTLHFAPYTSAQLLQILQSRLVPLRTDDGGERVDKLLPPSSLTLLSKKIAAMTGDVRCLFEVLRGSIDQAVSSTTKPTDPMEAPNCSVKPAHILAALKVHSPVVTSTIPAPSSEIVAKIQSLGLQARLTLLAILLASKRLEAGMSITTGVAPSIKRTSSSSNIGDSSSIDRAQLHTYYALILSRTESTVCQPVSRNEFTDLINMLDGVGLISTGSGTDSSPSKGKRAFGRSSSFAGVIKKGSSDDVKLSAGVLTEEVVRGLGVEIEGADASQDVREEEVRAIWRRESSRLAKDIKIASAKAVKRDESRFADACED